MKFKIYKKEAQILVTKTAKTPCHSCRARKQDEEDTCSQGAGCASLDLAAEGDKVTFLETAEDPGSWTALANGGYCDKTN